jgi:hypothetical protein
MERVIALGGSSGYSWVRWQVAGGKSNWHQVSEHVVQRVLGLRTKALLRLTRLQTRCGLDVFDVHDLEVWHAQSKPPTGTCISCTRRFLLDTLPPLGTPPVPGRKRDVRFTVRPRRKGSAEAPAVP